MSPEMVVKWIEKFNITDKKNVRKNIMNKPVSGNILCRLGSVEELGEELGVPLDVARSIFESIRSLKGGTELKISNIIDILYCVESNKESSIKRYEDITSDFYETLEESLESAGFESIKSLMKYSSEVARYAARKGLLDNLKITQSDVMALTIYTYDFGPKDFEKNPYRLVNKRLNEQKKYDAEDFKGYILRLLAVLRKLPAYDKTKTLYRAVTNVKEYCREVGKELFWPGFTSTSSEESIAINFFNSIAIKGEKYIFEITGCFNKCYNIKDFSFHSNEDGKQF